MQGVSFFSKSRPDSVLAPSSWLLDRPDISRPRPDQLTRLHLFQGVPDPPGASAEGKKGGAAFLWPTEAALAGGKRKIEVGALAEPGGRSLDRP